ncbi:MAG: hypothetical protein ACYC9O_13570 [Candidatus Latescibacterota bacterium]
MIRRSFFLFFLMLCVSLAAGCANNSNPGQTGDQEVQAFGSATVTGDRSGSHTFTNQTNYFTGVVGITTITLIAPASGASVTMNFTGQTPGAYACGQAAGNVLYFQSGLSTYGSLNQSASCEIVVATYTSSRITGSFSGVLFSGSRRVSIEGEFTVPRPQ